MSSGGTRRLDETRQLDGTLISDIANRAFDSSRIVNQLGNQPDRDAGVLNVDGSRYESFGPTYGISRSNSFPELPGDKVQDSVAGRFVPFHSGVLSGFWSVAV